mgnify:CR=1 FL=1
MQERVWNKEEIGLFLKMEKSLMWRHPVLGWIKFGANGLASDTISHEMLGESVEELNTSVEFNLTVILSPSTAGESPGRIIVVMYKTSIPTTCAALVNRPLF